MELMKFCYVFAVMFFCRDGSLGSGMGFRFLHYLGLSQVRRDRFSELRFCEYNYNAGRNSENVCLVDIASTELH